jgi:hypothetical protein
MNDQMMNKIFSKPCVRKKTWSHYRCLPGECVNERTNKQIMEKMFWSRVIWTIEMNIKESDMNTELLRCSTQNPEVKEKLHSLVGSLGTELGKVSWSHKESKNLPCIELKSKKGAMGRQKGPLRKRCACHHQRARAASRSGLCDWGRRG